MHYEICTSFQDNLKNAASSIYNFTIKGSNVKDSIIDNESLFTPLIYDNITQTLKLNYHLFDTYRNFNREYKRIKNNINYVIANFIKSGGTIRDLLYRMNTISPIEREYMNRANKLHADYNNNNENFVASYKTCAKDDTHIYGVMVHELEAILMFLLHKTGYSINIEYKPCYIMQTIINILKEKESCSIKDIILYDTNTNKCDLGTITISKDVKKCIIDIKEFLLLCYNGFMDMIYNNFTSMEYSIFMHIIANSIIKRDYIKFKDDGSISYNDKLKFFCSEHFRKVLYDMTIAIRTDFLLYFIDKYIIISLNNMKLSNPIDEALWGKERELQRILLKWEELENDYHTFSEYMNLYITYRGGNE